MSVDMKARAKGRSRAGGSPVGQDRFDDGAAGGQASACGDRGNGEGGSYGVLF